MIKLIGREFSKQTLDLKALLEKRGLKYEFVDIDFNEEAREWVKLHKIMGLPVLIKGNNFIVGENKEAIEKILSM